MENKTIFAIDAGNTQRNYCVYMHINKINQKKYIGITSQKPNCRWKKGEGYRECIRFYNAIKKYGWENFEHLILCENLSLEEAEQKEIELIKKYKTNYAQYGYNIANGGNCKGKVSEETKKKISNATKGKKFSLEHKRKIGESQKGEKNHNYGKKAPDEIRKKMTEGQLKHPNSGQFLSRKINQYDLQGNFIKTWQSMGEIYRELGLKHCGISDCCRGKQKTSGGYVWKYCV